ncbi:MAG TPA: transglycosylase SLT domain-containing protein [Rhodopila sp.]|nr:transglycosylase SLT domain-containing protein [Rhodopila sp.]
MRASLSVLPLLLLTVGSAFAQPAPSAHPLIHAGGTTRGTASASQAPRPAAIAATATVADPATQCETAVTTAEYVHHLPPRLLAAISLTETARTDPRSGRLRPWPWTINAEGQGQIFETKQEAMAAVQALQARGVNSIDVGCLQVNLMFHPKAFASLDEAFDPRANADYAARFLNRLYADGHDWLRAIAAYHSETPALGDMYRVLVMARWQGGDLHAQLPTRSAYQDFTPASQVYGAFAPATQVYGAFAPH